MSDPQPSPLGRLLEQARTSQGLTRAEAARQIGMDSDVPLFRWERHGTEPRGTVLVRLMRLYELSVNAVIEVVGEK